MAELPQCTCSNTSQPESFFEQDGEIDRARNRRREPEMQAVSQQLRNCFEFKPTPELKFERGWTKLGFSREDDWCCPGVIWVYLGAVQTYTSTLHTAPSLNQS